MYSFPHCKRRRSLTRSVPRLRPEVLEPRNLLATVVDTNIDELDGSIVDGDVSLRDAIASGDSSILFDSSLDGETIRLTLGVLEIAHRVSIDSSSLTSMTIDAGDSPKIFRLTSEQVLLSGLSLTGADDVAIEQVGGNATLADCHIQRNNRGVFVESGELRVTNCDVSNNVTDGIVGGALLTAFEDGDGRHTASTVVVDASRLQANRSSGIRTNGNLTVRNSRISGNVTGISAFGLRSISRYTPGSGWVGPGGTKAQVEVFRSVVSQNSSGISFNGGELTVSGSVITGNSFVGISATYEEFLYNAYYERTSPSSDITISSSTVSRNGIGVSLVGSSNHLIEGSTISENRRVGVSISNADEEGSRNASLGIRSSTVSGNRFGIVASADNDESSVWLSIQYSTITQNSDGGVRSTGYRGDPGGADASYSIIAGNGSFELKPNVVGVECDSCLMEGDPRLGPLANNGGTNRTHLPRMDSPAIDAIALNPNTLAFDQRGQPFDRIVNGMVDLGAIERQEADVDLGDSHCSSSALLGDINSDFVVDAGDLNILALNWQEFGDGFCGDLNNDWRVDQHDLNILASSWLTRAEPARMSMRHARMLTFIVADSLVGATNHQQKFPIAKHRHANLFRRSIVQAPTHKREVVPGAEIVNDEIKGEGKQNFKLVKDKNAPVLMF